MDILDREKYFKTKDTMMCNRWTDSYKKSLFTEIVSNQVERGEYKVKGVLTYSLAAISVLKPLYIQYWAASPPNYMTSFSGSGLPYANEDIAFENTPTKGVAPVLNGSYSFYINYPNSYYTNLGTTYIPPSVHLQVVDDQNNILTPVHTIQLGKGIPFRTESAPSFPQNKSLSLQSQWKNMVTNSYPQL